MDVLNLMVEKYCEFPRVLRKPMWQVWHKLLIRSDKNVNVNFMNYGYSNLNGEDIIRLHQQDEINRYCIQLYDHVVNNNDLKNKDILEVGSGRGGGASYITRYYMPNTYTGLDISSSIIAFCNRYYDISGLSFVKGAAENQPFNDHSFDIVVNVESARCYSNLDTFFLEVKRVLKPGGYFLLADMIQKEEVETMHTKLEESGFNIMEKKNITDNVVSALEKDSARREALIEKYVPGFLKSSFSQFAGTLGTERYLSFAQGKFEYWSYILNSL